MKVLTRGKENDAIIRETHMHIDRCITFDELAAIEPGIRRLNRAYDEDDGPSGEEHLRAWLRLRAAFWFHRLVFIGPDEAIVAFWWTRKVDRMIGQSLEAPTSFAWCGGVTELGAGGERIREIIKAEPSEAGELHAGSLKFADGGSLWVTAYFRVRTVGETEEWENKDRETKPRTDDPANGHGSILVNGEPFRFHALVRNSYFSHSGFFLSHAITVYGERDMLGLRTTAPEAEHGLPSEIRHEYKDVRWGKRNVQELFGGTHRGIIIFNGKECEGSFSIAEMTDYDKVVASKHRARSGKRQRADRAFSGGVNGTTGDSGDDVLKGRGDIGAPGGMRGDIEAMEKRVVTAFKDEKELIAHSFSADKTVLVFSDGTVEIDTTTRPAVRNKIPVAVARDDSLDPGCIGLTDAPVTFDDGHEERLRVFFKPHDQQRLRIVKHIQTLVANPGCNFGATQSVKIDGKESRIFEASTTPVPDKRAVLIFLETQALRYSCAVTVAEAEVNRLGARGVTVMDTNGPVTFSNGKAYPILRPVEAASLPDDLQALRLRQLEIENRGYLPTAPKSLRKTGGGGFEDISGDKLLVKKASEYRRASRALDKVRSMQLCPMGEVVEACRSLPDFVVRECRALHEGKDVVGYAVTYRWPPDSTGRVAGWTTETFSPLARQSFWDEIPVPERFRALPYLLSFLNDLAEEWLRYLRTIRERHDAASQHDYLREAQGGGSPSRSLVPEVIRKTVSAAVRKEIEPLAETFRTAALAITPRHERKAWENLRFAHDRIGAETDKEKWLILSHIVSTRVLELKDGEECEYLTPRMLRTFRDKLNKKDAQRKQVEAFCADSLRRYVAYMESKSKPKHPASAKVPRKPDKSPDKRDRR